MIDKYNHDYGDDHANDYHDYHDSSSPNSNPHTFRWLASVRRYVLPPKNEKIIPPEEKIVKVK